MPPVETISPSKLHPAATTESVWPVNFVGANVSALNGCSDAEGIGQNMNPRSSSPPDTANGGFGNRGCREIVNIDWSSPCSAGCQPLSSFQ
jgi:hypothetical protein